MNLSLERLPTSSWRFKHLIAVLALGWVLAGCTRTVHWEEEVLLNTGETIWVKRSGTYTYRSASGNPLDYGYQPDWVSTIEFSYQTKIYVFKDDASLILLAIAPDGRPNLVADAADHDWQWKNKHFCVTPYYAHFRPDESGKRWTWPAHIDGWLFGLPTNLMFGVPELASSGQKFIVADRVQHNASLTVRNKELQAIDPTYASKTCPKRK